MQASTVRLSSPFVSKGFLVPPRTSWDIFKSAANASWKLLWSQEKRDEFVETLNKGIIRLETLSRADHGSAMALALFHDLDSPVFKRYNKFNPGEFCEGVKDALIQFHDVQGKLENTIYEDVYSVRKEALEEHTTTGNDKKELEVDAEKENDGAPSSTRDGEIMQILEAFGTHTNKAELAAILKVTDKTKEMKQLIKKDWNKLAETEPESLAGQLLRMVTPQYFKMIQDFARTKWLIGDKWIYQDESSEIEHVALLSARAHVVDDTEENSGEDAKNPKVNKEDENGPQVAAQVEVLYDIKQTFTLMDKVDESASEEEREKNLGDTESISETTVTRPNVWVGVFEGWLNGNPDGTTDLRWKLVFNRQAWEFRSLDSSSY